MSSLLLYDELLNNNLRTFEDSDDDEDDNDDDDDVSKPHLTRVSIVRICVCVMCTIF